MNYIHLTIVERACLRKYYVEGKVTELSIETV